MAKIIIDGREVQCRDKIPVLQAALEAGLDVPHYCYHPGLSIVASCRLCLMEMKMPDPKTKEMAWSPKLVPSCQTPVRDGMEVRFASPAVENSRRHVMEYYLVNHPLDCPVCDKAGECYLQDYDFAYGPASSRAVDPKYKNPKKDIGPRTLLYQDRCVMCSRCVRFVQEVAGTGELCIVNRGNRSEIDVFPGAPLDNKLQGNVVDLCPVGSLLDKDFLFRRRVWFLKTGDSICRGCSTGCAIHVDEHRGAVQRLRPRYNPGVNDWWMCDEGRFGWKFVADERRIASPTLKRGSVSETPAWEALPGIVRLRLTQIAAKAGPASLA
ncbi:MAG: (2Fe-2S)-binding protein, partial [Phycisphaerae bacterium]